MPLQPDSKSEESRVLEDHYRTYFGFDPAQERHQFKQYHFKYTTAFPLARDPILHARGIEIVAEVRWIEKVGALKSVKTKIRLRSPSGEDAEIRCVHVAVTEIPTSGAREIDWNELDILLEQVDSTEIHPINLSPEDHFVALRSYVAGVAEMGIQNMMHLTYDGHENHSHSIPFGFTSAMQFQLLWALAELDGELANKFVEAYFFDLLDQAPARWFLRHLPLIDEVYFYPIVAARLMRRPEQFDARPLSTIMQDFLFYDGARRERILKKLDLPRFLEIAILSESSPRSWADPVITELLKHDPNALGRLAWKCAHWHIRFPQPLRDAWATSCEPEFLAVLDTWCRGCFGNPPLAVRERIENMKNYNLSDPGGQDRN